MDINIMEVVFILDASGSMFDMTDDTIGGFNSMLQRQRGKDGTVLVSTITFNTKSTVIHDRVNIDKVKDLTRRDYVACGNTALIDAIGSSIHHISNVHKYIRKEDVPKKTIFIITTDGMENASHKYSSNKVKHMVEQKRELGWEFIFMGANIDSVETAKDIGIDAYMAANYENTRHGNRRKFEAMSCVLEEVRDIDYRGELSDKWKDELNKDVK